MITPLGCSGAARSLSLCLGVASVTLAALTGCGNTNPLKTTGAGGSGGSPATTASSSSGTTDGTGAGTTSTSTSMSTSASTSTSTSTGTGGGGSGCSSLPLCDDFESDTAGMPPSSSLWTILGAAGCSGSSPYSIAVDTAQAHSGTHSVKVTGGDSCGPLMVNTSAFPKITGGDVYGRFYVRLPAESPFDHAALMTLGLTAGADKPGMSLDQSTHLSLAPEQAGTANVLMWQTTDGNILPDKNSMGGASSTYPAADTWTCIEFHTSSTGALETWVGGVAVTGLTYVPGTTTKTQGVNDQWTPLSPFAPTSLGLGWIAFSAPQLALWIDDVALGPSRIGCN